MKLQAAAIENTGFFLPKTAIFVTFARGTGARCAAAPRSDQHRLDRGGSAAAEDAQRGQ